MRSNQLVGGSDSAQAYLLSARRIDPADPDLQKSVAELASMLQTNARKAVREDRLEEAEEWLDQAVVLDVDRPAVAKLRSEIELARLDNVREDHARLFTLTNQRIAQGSLIEPAADSARHYLDLLRAADPAYEGLQETGALFASKALEEAGRLAAAGNVGDAETLLQVANDAGAPAAAVAAVATAVAKARAALATPRPPVPAVLPENALHRTYFVKPDYPKRALERGISGWVDIEFTVTRDGSTREAAVRASEPIGVFDRAALASVARWRYEPRVVDGVIIDQRVSARVRFELED
jgi:TonB family protein